MLDAKINLRATQEDHQNVLTIAQIMRANGKPHATRTDAVRFALRETAERANAEADWQFRKNCLSR
jgi:hypothetical protein